MQPIHRLPNTKTPVSFMISSASGRELEDEWRAEQRDVAGGQKEERKGRGQRRGGPTYAWAGQECEEVNVLMANHPAGPVRHRLGHPTPVDSRVVAATPTRAQS